MTWSYTAHGLRVDSEIELHGLTGSGVGTPDLTLVLGAPAPIDVRVPEGRLILESGAGGPGWVAIAEHTDGWVVRYPGFAEFHLTRDRRTMTAVRPPERPGDEWVALLAIGNPFALWLTLAGDVALHASAVALDDRAIAFVGPSGCGKSTTACSLATFLGARIISDDLLRVDPNQPVSCFRGAVDMRLRHGPSTEVVAGPAARRPTVDERVSVRHPSIGADEVALDAIVLPRPHRDASPPRVERLSTADALFQIMAGTRLVGWQEPATQREQFNQLADLVERVPVIRADVPWAASGPQGLGECVRGILLAADGPSET